jgi:putative FmdB family regulatory protein
MPIYEYSCNNCGNCFEQLVFNSEDEKNITCGKCGAREVKKVISSFSCINQGGESGISGCSSNNGFS